MNKMQFVLREIPEKFSTKGGYTGRFVNQKGLDGRAVIEEAISMDYVPAYSPSQVKACAMGLLESMLAGVARDGNPRSVDGFLKVTPILKGRFEKADSSYDPKVNGVAVNVQLLKELKPIDTSNWSFLNVTDGGDAPEPPGPTPSFTVTGVHNEETESPNIYVGRSLLFDGTGLDAWGDGDRIEVKRLGDGETDWESITGTDDVTVTPSDGILWVSTDWWSCISFGVEDGIQIRFRVTIGTTSAEVTGTVHEE